MANVKVTDLTDLGSDQIGNYTWFLASHENEDHDEISSRKVAYPELSARIYDDCNIENINAAIDIATGETPKIINDIKNDIQLLNASFGPLQNNVSNNSKKISEKQDILISGTSIKTLTINNGEPVDLIGSGTININTSGGGGSEPSEYIKSAQVLNNSTTLKLTKKDGTTVEFTPPTSGGQPAGWNELTSQVDENTQDISQINEKINTKLVVKDTTVTISDQTIGSDAIEIKTIPINGSFEAKVYTAYVTSSDPDVIVLGTNLNIGSIKVSLKNTTSTAKSGITLTAKVYYYVYESTQSN